LLNAERQIGVAGSLFPRQVHLGGPRQALADVPNGRISDSGRRQDSGFAKPTAFTGWSLISVSQVVLRGFLRTPGKE